MGVMNEERLTLYDGLIKTHITNTTVAKEEGKVLSTNDYTTSEKNKLDGLNDTLLNKLGEASDGSLTYNGNEIKAKTDTELSLTSENPVQNKIITGKLNEKADSMVYDEDNSKLKLMNGTTVLSEVTVSGGGSANGATIGVLTSESTLIGKEVVLSKDSITIKTGQFNVSGICTFSGIEDTGTYTITATDGTDTTSEDVTVTTDDVLNKSVLQVTLTFVPDGETVTPTDDVGILLKCAEVKGTDYTTIAEVLADDSAMYEITAHEESMKYLARSTSFADDLCADETFMTYLGSSAYVDATILNSDLWVEKLKASPYKLQVSPYQVCAYSTASDNDLKNMLDGYYSGWLTIDDIKTKNSVGDSRSVSLSSMSATGVGESHRAQTVQFVIGDFEHDDLTTAINGHTKAAITLLQKDCLMDAANESNPVNGQNDTENGYMNSTDTNVGGWKSCARRTWCNNVYLSALPSNWQSIVKTVNKKVSVGNNSSTIETVQDKIFFAAEIEIFGSTTHSFAGEGTKYQYYKNATANRYKNPKLNSSYVSHVYWERSPRRDKTNCFCYMDADGAPGYSGAIYAYGLAPCLCI